MTTSREWQLIALNTMYANLQRAHVFDRSTHLITGTAEDEARSAVLRGWMDAVANAFQAALVEEEVNAQTQQALLPLAPWLEGEVERYYAQHVSDAPLREQAAFGAAHVYASDYQDKGELAIAKACGHAEQADRLLQHRPLMISLINQAKIAVGTAAEGEPTEEAMGYIREHVAVAERDEGRMRLQVGAIPVMLIGQDPRG